MRNNWISCINISLIIHLERANPRNVEFVKTVTVVNQSLREQYIQKGTSDTRDSAKGTSTIYRILKTKFECENYIKRS